MALPASAILGGVGTLAQVLMQGSANASNNALNWENLFEQKRQAREREKLAKADREDAFGNKVRFREGIGFQTKLTPFQQAIMNAQQKEQLAQFRQDAPRQREAAERLDKRSRDAGEVYDEKFNDYRYSRKKSKDEFVAEAIREAVEARRGNGGENIKQLVRAALRTNNSGAIPDIVNASKSSGNTLTEAIANAKKEGRQRYFVENNAETQSRMGELGSLKSIADQSTPATLNFNNENNALSGRSDQALNTLIQSNLASSQAVGNAASRAATMKPVDLSALTQSLQALVPGEKPTPKQQQLIDLLLDQKIGGAQLGILRNDQQLSAYKPNSRNF